MSTSAVDAIQAEIQELESDLERYSTAAIKTKIASLQRRQMQAAEAEARERAEAAPLLAEATQDLKQSYAWAIEALEAYIGASAAVRAARGRYEAAGRRARAAGLEVEHVMKFAERCAQNTDDGHHFRNLRDSWMREGRLDF